MTINDDSHRLLPGGVLGPFTTLPRTNGVGGGDAVTVHVERDPTCGEGDMDSYFRPGASYDVAIRDTPGYCAEADLTRRQFRDPVAADGNRLNP